MLLLLLLKQLKKDLPLLIIADGADEESLTALLQAGARDLVEIAKPARLEHTVMREARDRRLHELGQVVLFGLSTEVVQGRGQVSSGGATTSISMSCRSGAAAAAFSTALTSLRRSVPVWA